MDQNHESFASKNKLIIVAGATGDLGQRIVACLCRLNVPVRVLVRAGSQVEKVAALQQLGAQVAEVDFNSPQQLVQACAGGSCVVSALNGLEAVMIDVQTRLLEAAVGAGVPRFIPSDYSIDYTKLPYGSNRNLDLRRQFSEVLDRAPIAATSVLNGMFADLLTGQAPVVLFGIKRVMYWGDATQPLDFTTIEDTAAFTARVAMDDHTPRFLRVAGTVANAKQLAQIAGKVTGENFRLLRAGSLNRLQTMIRIVRTLFPQKKEVFPPWQGMQYMHNMFTGKPKLAPLDNDRYPGMHWTSVQEVLAKRIS